MRKGILKCSWVILGSVISLSCESIKPYQRIYVNDYEMKMGQVGARTFEENVHMYREGAAGGGSSKSSGGCGCN